MSKMRDEIIRLKETPIKEDCPVCEGDGYIEIETPKPANFNRDVGYLDTDKEQCETCSGEGKVDRLCSECDNPVTQIRGPRAKVCEECADE